MEFVSALLTLAGMHLLMAMLPGPNTVIVSWLSATVSRRAGLEAMSGIVLASLVWVVLSLWGVGTLLTEAGDIYRGLRLLGAAYLVYLGLRMLRAGWRAPIGASAAVPPASSTRNPFLAGFLTTISNPKSAVFWTSAFLVAMPQHAPAWLYIAIVAVIAVPSALWYGSVVLLFSTGLARRHYQRFARKLDLLAGAVMVALGLRLAEEVRREIMVRAAT